jgi:hypothetical protein
MAEHALDVVKQIAHVDSTSTQLVTSFDDVDNGKLQALN